MLLTILLTAVFATFSTTVLAYTSISTGIGPWINTTLVLMASLIFAAMRIFISSITNVDRRIMLAVAGGSVGGILATAFGFSFPTLFFLDPATFNHWIEKPTLFIFAVSGLALIAGWLGIMLADWCEHRMLIEQQLPFAVGELAYKMVTAHHQLSKAYELTIGFLGTTLFCILQTGITICQAWIPRCLTGSLIPEKIILSPAISFGPLTIPSMPFEMMPIYWSIGFVTGLEIMTPLIAGAILKFVGADTINHLWFPHISSQNFILAFASGMIVAGTLSSFISTPKTLVKGIKSFFNKKTGSSGFALSNIFKNIETWILVFIIATYLSYFEFPLFEQIYLVVFTLICAYLMLEIAGKLGLAQLGRWATFVMVPALFIFKPNPVQITIIATFVEICGGVASDILFNRKMGHLGGISSGTMKRYQLFGLAISSLIVSFVLLLLIKKFGLGSPELFAQRAQTRALLVKSGSVDLWVLAIGAVVGALLKYIHLNPMWVLGGLLMPINITLGLSFGAVLTKLTKRPDEWTPFWSGVFAANSLWMALKALI